MKNYSFIVLFLLMTTSGLFAQVNFEKGYFITENGQKTECYIKNEDWKNTPSKFNYKLTLDGDVKVLRLINLKSVVITNAFKFEKHTVNFDDSPRALGKLSLDRNPNFVKKTLLLNVLLEGKATLYSYVDTDVRAFFYKKDTEKVEPLIYKIFTTEDRKILYNSRYRQQLLTALACEKISEKAILKVDYNAGDLTSFFLKYNECKGGSSVKFEKKEKGFFSIRPTIGLNNAKAKAVAGTPAFLSLDEKNVDFQSKWTPRVGIDVEYVLPFNKNKWAIFIEPSYFSYEGDASYQFPFFSEQSVEIEYSAIQIPVGIRHYMFINDSSKLFGNLGFIMDIPLTSNIDGDITVKKGDISTSAGIILGLGYAYNDKYFFEVRYTSPREILEKTTADFSAKIQAVSFILGYKIF